MRDHGGVIFIDVRDKSGIIQIVSDPELFPEAHKTIEKIRNEFVINVKGKIRLRSDNSVNPKLPTGKIEILAESVEIFNTCVPLPFQIEDDIDNNKKLSKDTFQELKGLVRRITTSQEEYAEKYGKNKSIQSDSIKRKERIKNIDVELENWRNLKLSLIHI